MQGLGFVVGYFAVAVFRARLRVCGLAGLGANINPAVMFWFPLVFTRPGQGHVLKPADQVGCPGIGMVGSRKSKAIGT